MVLSEERYFRPETLSFDYGVNEINIRNHVFSIRHWQRSEPLQGIVTGTDTADWARKDCMR